MNDFIFSLPMTMNPMGEGLNTPVAEGLHQFRTLNDSILLCNANTNVIRLVSEEGGNSEMAVPHSLVQLWDIYFSLCQSVTSSNTLLKSLHDMNIGLQPLWVGGEQVKYFPPFDLRRKNIFALSLGCINSHDVISVTNLLLLLLTDTLEAIVRCKVNSINREILSAQISDSEWVDLFILCRGVRINSSAHFLEGVTYGVYH